MNHSLKVYQFNGREKPATHPLTPIYMTSSNEWHLSYLSSVEPKRRKLILTCILSFIQIKKNHNPPQSEA